MPARQPRVPHFLFAPSSLPSVPQLQLLPSLLLRPEAPILLPHPPWVLSPQLNSALPRERLQHRQIFSNTHVPLCPEQIQAQPSAGSSAHGIFGPSSFQPPAAGSPGEFLQLPVVWVRCIPRLSHTLGACLGLVPLPPWWGPWGSLHAQGTATNQEQRRDHSPAQIPGLCRVVLALLPKAVSNVPRFQPRENLPDL